MLSVGWGGEIFSWLHRHSQTKAGDKREHGHSRRRMCAYFVLLGGEGEHKPSYAKETKKLGMSTLETRKLKMGI